MSKPIQSRPHIELPSASPAAAMAPISTSIAEAVGERCIIADRPRASLALLTLTILAVLGTLYLARDLVLPVALAVTLALLLRPFVRRFRRLRIPDFISAAIVLGGVILVLVIGAAGLISPASRWIGQSPEMLREVSEMARSYNGPFQDLQAATAEVQNLTRAEAEAEPIRVELQSAGLADTVLDAGSAFMASTIVVFVLCYFLLATGDQVLNNWVGAMPSFCEKRNVVRLVQNVEQGVSRYLVTITVINLGLGICTGLAMWLIGMPNPVLWGVMAAILNYVPYIGAFAGMAIIFVVGTITTSSLTYGAGAAGLFALFTTIEGYFITPAMLSRSLQLSALAVFLSLIFWGWLWGMWGAVLAAPILAILKISCDQFESTRGFGAVLGGEPLSPSEKTSRPPPAPSILVTESEFSHPLTPSSA